MTRRARSLTLLLAFAAAAPAAAQSLRSQCSAFATSAAVAYCGRVAESATIMPARIGIAATGGNPNPGTASTVGMRVPGRPRVDVALRATTAAADLPAIERANSSGGDSFQVFSTSADVSVGLFSGVTVAPTVGGFAAIDVLGSIGIVPARGRRFDGDSPLTWALGARLGVMRESFTAPGISVSAMYRALPDVEYGDTALNTTDAHYRLRAQRVTSVRGVIGKRVLGLGFTAGAGYDRYGSDIDLRVSNEALLEPLTAHDRDFDTSRVSAFGNVSFTRLILHLVGELGWQLGGDAAPGETKTGQGALFGGVAIRLAL